MLIGVENKPGCPSLDHLKLGYIFFEVGVPNGGAVICYYLWEDVAKWIGHWTQDQKVWGSIPSAGHV